MPRSTRRELLDEPDVDPDELRRNLSEMAMLNRLPGGVDASVAATVRLLPGEADGSGRVLDVGAGAADYARRLRRRSRATIVLVDVSPRVLAATRAAVAGMAGVEVREADARDLPMPDGAVDVAHASLLLHHLDPHDATAAFAEMGRVARAGVVVNDLRRGRLPLAMTAAPILAFARSPMTRHDGILSSRRAYTLHELDDLAATAGLRPMARTTHWWPRVTTTYR